MADIAHDFTTKVCLGAEDSSGNDVALDFGEPDFHLVEPRGIGGGIVDADLGIGLEESGDTLGFVGGEIIGDNVNLLTVFDAGNSLRNSTNSALVWRLTVFPWTCPVAVSKAA